MTTTEESISYKCVDPPPQLVTYTNSITNETKTESVPAKINSLQVVFDYSIFHTDDTSFGAKKAQEESKGVLESISDTISDTVNNLFGDDEDKVGKENLMVLEKCMVENMWKAMLADEMMTYVEGDESQCAGFIIDEVSRRFLQDGINNTLIEIEQDEPIVSDNTNVDQSQPLVVDDAAMDQTQPVVIEDATVIETVADISDTSDNEEVDSSATTFTGTKLIGMDSFPLDVINTAGCASGPSSCTFVRGIISASYIGTNENAVSDTIARMIQDGMKAGSLLCEGSPATKLEFDSFVSNGKGGHGALILDTNRGMAPEESNDLTSYGIMFVLFVALLSVGVIFGVLYKRKKKQKAMGTAAVSDFEANLELEEGAPAARSQTPDISVSSDNRMTRMVETSTNNNFGTSEVELSLSPKSVT